MSRRLSSITDCIISLSLTNILACLPLLRFPQGGTISLIPIPLLILSFRQGAKIASFTSCLAGLSLLMWDGHFLHPIQIVLDYGLSYLSFGLVGYHIKPNSPALLARCSLAFLSYFTCLFISGICFYGLYAPNKSPLIFYSLGYNASYCLPQATLVTLIILVIYQNHPRLLFPNQKGPL